MSDYMYVATDGQVDAPRTAQLLRDWNAIWCIPSVREPWRVDPDADDRLWLVWISAVGATEEPLLLGGGRLLSAPEERFGSNLMWTNAFAPGIRPAAEALGYGGPTNMSFLRVDQTSPEAKSTEVTWPEFQEIRVPGLIPQN